MLISLKFILLQVFFTAFAQEQLHFQNINEFQFLTDQIDKIETEVNNKISKKLEVSRAIIHPRNNLQIQEKIKDKIKEKIQDKVHLKNAGILKKSIHHFTSKNRQNRIFHFKKIEYSNDKDEKQYKSRKKKRWIRSR